MTAFVPALTNSKWQGKTSSLTPSQATLSKTATPNTLSPISRATTQPIISANVIAPTRSHKRLPDLAASLRDPETNHSYLNELAPIDTTDGSTQPQGWGRLISQFFGAQDADDQPLSQEPPNEKPSGEPNQADTDNPLSAPKTDNVAKLSETLLAKLDALGVRSGDSSPPPSTKALQSGIDQAYLSTLDVQTGTDDADQTTSRLPIPSCLGNLFGRGKQSNAYLNGVTLEAPWQRNLRDKEIMTFLKLGFVSRFVYQKLAAPHHKPQIDAFEATLAKAGYGVKTVSVGDNLWGIVAHRDNEVMLCFRGTAFWDDMWRNIQFWPSLNKNVPENESTHHGMSHVFEQLWPEIDKILTDIAKHTRRPLQVYTSGHSLGGSFAKLTALRLANKQDAKAASYKADARMVCTYGAPKTFFKPSAERYRALGLDHKTITITQHQDIVPELPPNFLSPYETVGNRLYITRDGALWYKPEDGCIDEDKFRESPGENGGNGRPNRWVSDHVLDSYLIVLDAHKQMKLPKPLPPGHCPSPREHMVKLSE